MLLYFDLLSLSFRFSAIWCYLVKLFAKTKDTVTVGVNY